MNIVLFHSPPLMSHTEITPVNVVSYRGMQGGFAQFVCGLSDAAHNVVTKRSQSGK